MMNIWDVLILLIVACVVVFAFWCMKNREKKAAVHATAVPAAAAIMAKYALKDAVSNSA